MKKNFNIDDEGNEILSDAAYAERVPEAEFIRRAIRERAKKRLADAEAAIDSEYCEKSSREIDAIKKEIECQE